MSRTILISIFVSLVTITTSANTQNSLPAIANISIHTDSLIYTNTIIKTSMPPKVWANIVNNGEVKVYFPSCYENFASFGIEQLVNGNWKLWVNDLNCTKTKVAVNSQSMYKQLTLPLIIDTLRYVFLCSLDSSFSAYDSVRSNEFIINDGNITSAKISREGNIGFVLEQNFPNPFNPATTIRYRVSTRSFVILTVFNILGQKIKNIVNSIKEIGSYEEQFDASHLQTGIYFYRLQADNYVATKKLIIIN